MISFPFNSNITNYDNEGLPVFDRAIDANDYRRWTSLFFTNGVSAASTDFMVTAGQGMTVLVSPGKCNVQGVLAFEDNQRELIVQAADTLDRIDRVVLRLNEENRTVDLYIKKGTAATTPVAPTLTRPKIGEAGDVYEIGIADIYIPKNNSTISNSRITDLRLNTSLCGVIAQAIKQLDTTVYFTQLNQLVTEYGDKFNIWFDSIKNILDDSVATNLFNLIEQQQIEIDSKLASTTAASTYLTKTVAGNTYAKKITNVNADAPASWSGSAVPYTLTITVSGVVSTSNVFVSLRNGASIAQATAYARAMISDGGQSTNSITLKAYGTKPTIAIPLSVSFI